MSPLALLLEQKLGLHDLPSAQINPSVSSLTAKALHDGEAILTKSGSLGSWGPSFATGRIPDDTYTVRYDDDDSVDWSQKNNHPMSPDDFDLLFQDALQLLKMKRQFYVTDRIVGAKARYALPVRTITDSALTALFTYTMFRDATADMRMSVFAGNGFTLLVLPHDAIHAQKCRGVLREVCGAVVDHAVVMDFRRRAGIVFGTSYLGAVKKMIFTTMNHLLPEHDVLPLHCAAVEDWQGSTHLFLGLSGTGKTTLSSGPGLTMIGDDEHAWSSSGISNLENGCYAKLMHLSPKKEREIHAAVFSPVDDGDLRPIIENAMIYPDGSVDVDDARLTENSRAAYLLSRLKSVKPSAQGAHPSTIIFLTADVRGILPPIAKLPLQQAMLWFLMGYTSKLAGTETDVSAPTSTFSRFFGGAFMPRKSGDYLTLFQKLVTQHRPEIFLVNTGWSGGPPGVGKRMDIALTRRLVDAVHWGQLKDVPYREDPLFHLLIPRECPGVEPALLDPRRTWTDKKLYDTQAKTLAEEFSRTFDKFCTGDLQEALQSKCPGR